MRIVVNTRYLLKDKLEGMGWFTYHVMKRWVTDHPEHEFIFLFDRPFDSSFIFSDNVKGVVLGPKARHPILFYLWYEWKIPAYLKKVKADLFVSTDGFSSASTDVPTLYVLHDIAWYHFPRHIYYSARKFYSYYVPKYCENAERIATVSEYSKRDIMDTYAISEAKIDVVYNGSSEQYKPLSSSEVRQIRAELTDGCPYFIYIGSVNERKNLARLITAFDQFKTETGSTMKLILAGGATGKSQQLHDWVNEINHSDDIQVLGYVEDERLGKILGAAYALAYVSLFEGFGIPILEAQNCHVPAICSNTSSMPEVAGKAGILIDPKSIEQIRDAMITITGDTSLYERLRVACEVEKSRFTWAKTSNLMWDCLQKIKA